MNKYEIDSIISFEIERSKKNQVNIWDDFFNKKIKIDNFVLIIYDNLKLNATKSFHVKYIKERIKHSIKSTYEEIIYDE